MMRPWQTWLLFAACLGLPVAALSWATWRGLELDRAEIRGRIHAAFEENVRLSLWRMDSSLAGLIAAENARDVVEYRSLFAPGWPAAAAPEGNAAAAILLESPLLVHAPPRILLHFEIDPDGEVRSPQVPEDRRLYELVVERRGYRDRRQWQHDADLLGQLADRLDYRTLAARLPDAGDDPAPLVALDPQSLAQRPGERQELAELIGRDNLARQHRRSADEYQHRAAYGQIMPRGGLKVGDRDGAGLEQAEPIRLDDIAILPPSFNVDNTLLNTWQFFPIDAMELAGASGAEPWHSPPAIRKGGMQATWADGGLLVLARRVAVGEREVVQGAVLDWPRLQRELAESVADLVPEGRILPAEDGAGNDGARRMATLPVVLDPGRPPSPPRWQWTPMTAALAVAWAGVLLAGGAVTMLLRGTLALSERRAAFVSAVTHELRTPLTTFRMYTEMLCDGMVRDEQKRRAYLQTLGSESDRLCHLVENVLAYAQLERGTARTRIETLSVGAMLERMVPRLRRRLEQAGLDLVLELPEDLAQRELEMDLTAIEQVLFNLVDNAAKYAAGAADRRVLLTAAVASALPGRDGGADRLVLSVRDFGPGIEATERRKLFQPFSKSARDAAGRAPGVGLGLALGRRLARQLGGELEADASVEPGVRFRLILPWRRPGG